MKADEPDSGPGAQTLLDLIRTQRSGAPPSAMVPEWKYILDEVHHRAPFPLNHLTVASHMVFARKSVEARYFDRMLALVGDELVGRVGDDGRVEPGTLANLYDEFSRKQTSRRRQLFRPHDYRHGHNLLKPERLKEGNPFKAAHIIRRLREPAVLPYVLFGNMEEVRARLATTSTGDKVASGGQARLLELARFLLVWPVFAKLVEDETQSLSDRAIREVRAENLEPAQPDYLAAGEVFRRLEFRSAGQAREDFSRHEMVRKADEPGARDIVAIRSLYPQNENHTIIERYSDLAPEQVRAWVGRMFHDGTLALDSVDSAVAAIPAGTDYSQLPGEFATGAHYVFIPLALALHLVPRCQGATRLDPTDERHLPDLAEAAVSLLLRAKDAWLDAPDWRRQDADGMFGRFLSGVAPTSTLAAVVENSLGVGQVSRIQDGFQDNPWLFAGERGRAALDRFAIAFLRRQHGFQTAADPRLGQPDLVISRVLDGGAYYMGDLRMLPDLGKQETDGFTRSLILDVTLCRHQRGRLLHRLSEIATFRVLALRDVRQMRWAVNSINHVSHQFSLLQSKPVGDPEHLQWLDLSGRHRHGTKHSGKPSRPARLFHLLMYVPYFILFALGRTKRRPILPEGHARRTRKAMERLSSLKRKLSRYNLLIGYGISGRALSNETYRHLISARVDDLKEQRVGSYQTIAEFLRRRLLSASGTVERAHKRHDILRRRIDEEFDSLRTYLTAAQNDEQEHALRIVEPFIVLAAVYYLGQIIKHIPWLGKVLGEPWSYGLAGIVSIASYIALKSSKKGD